MMPGHAKFFRVFFSSVAFLRYLSVSSLPTKKTEVFSNKQGPYPTYEKVPHLNDHRNQLFHKFEEVMKSRKNSNIKILGKFKLMNLDTWRSTT